MKKYILPVIILIFFLAIAIMLWLSTNTMFYLYNFTYIGIFISLGIFLFIHKHKYARLVTQFGVGTYMLVYLGIVLQENMQIVGFWYYLFLGVFQAAVIHYLIAKIAGPLIFGRGWCGYACWSAMIFDLFPYKIPNNMRIKKLAIIKYFIFTISLIFVACLFVFNVSNIENIIFLSFIISNVLYYVIGILLALKLKDNRAFCKYICPITVFLKPMSYFSLLRIKIDKNECIHCMKCNKSCPMNVDILNNNRNRKNGTECILCGSCVSSCPKSAIKI